MKYATKSDIIIVIEILNRKKKELDGTFPSGAINRVIMDLEESKSIFNGDKIE